MTQKNFIDSHKGVTSLFVLLLIAAFGQWDNPTAWVYFGLHGSYGILWVLKSRNFGDKSWDKPCSPAYGLLIWAGLTLYWIAPWLIMSRGQVDAAWFMGLCVALYGFGVFFHFAADMQKHASMQWRPGVLLTEGLWARCRNPNYFGELLIYLSFALLALHWLPFVVLAGFVLGYWVPNMIRKDRSLSRYEAFEAYRRRSKLFIPYVI